MKRISRCFRGRTAGFTAIELMVVLVILGILTSLAMPGFSGFTSRTSVDSALNELTGDVSYARMLAIQTGRATRIEFGATGYRVWTLDANDAARLAKRVDLPAEYPGMTLTSTEPTLQFNSRGILQVGGSAIISAERNGISDAVRVWPTGRVYRES